jgi:hypothetical protein
MAAILPTADHTITENGIPKIGISELILHIE